MNALTESGVMSVLSPGGIFLGTLLRRMPDLNERAKDAVQLGVGWILIIAALVPLMSAALFSAPLRNARGRHEVRFHGAFGYCLRTFDLDQRRVDQP